MQGRKIIKHGDKSGNGMVVRFRLPSGLDIFGLATNNFYGGSWDLGPTWNYVVMADVPFLIDAGRYGQGKQLLEMMGVAGIKPSDLEFVLISHGHEDHDGGLAELVGMTDLKIRAHAIYDLLIRQYPDLAPTDYKRHFPAKCWHCFMPEAFYTANCLGYHGVLEELEIETIGSGTNRLGTDIVTCHLPGHSPDCLAVILGDEAIIVGDILLPQITPWPTRIEMYDEIAGVVGYIFPEAKEIFGLHCYIRTLKHLLKLSSKHPDMQVFPAHRLYYNERWNTINLTRRVDELIEHHIQRCAAIVDIISGGYENVEQIVERYFEPSLLMGPGKQMASNEIISHCEMMVDFGDLANVDNHRYEATGTNWFEALIRTI